MAWVEHAALDVRHAWRLIRTMPGLAAVVVASLGVGIGVNTAVFSWVQAVVLRPLPGVADAASFRWVEPRDETGSYPGVSWLEYRDLRTGLRSFRDLLASRMVPLNIGETGRTERTYGQLVSGNYFSALGLRPALGRFLRPDEVERPGDAPVVVVSYAYWQTRFGSAAGVSGQTLRVNGRELTIVGVAPRGFQGSVLGLNFDLWLPATLAPVVLSGSRELDDRSLRGYAVMGRLQPEASPAQVQGEVDVAMRQLAQAYPTTNATITGEVLPFWRAPRGPQRFLVPALAILQAVMLLLLLAVCGNTANLVLARASARQREIGVRLALGAGPWRVVRLVLTENLMLALLGAALGVVVAAWGTDALRAVPLTAAFPIKFQTGLDAVSVAFATLLAVGCGLVFGVPAAAQLARLDLQRHRAEGGSTPARSRLRNALMGSEVALALLVLLVAGLFLRSFRETQDTNPGFRRDGVLLAAYDLTGRPVDAPSTRTFASRLLERVRALPGVDAAAIAVSVPLDIHGLPQRSFALEGHARADASLDQALTNIVTPDYFRTMGIPLRAGTDFVDLDDLTTAAQVIVNEEFVRRYLTGREPIGRRLQTGGRSYVIAGVAQNSLYDAFGEPAQPFIYFSYRDRPAARGEIHLRTRVGAELALASEVQRVVRELDPGLPVYDVRTLAEHVDKNLVLRRIPARMFVVLGPLLLVLAAIGIYAVVSYTVASRTGEIGLRLALGATARRVVTQIVVESLAVIASGALAGWLVALVADLHLFGGSIDASVFLGVPAVLLAVATVASWVPAQRAARIDPITALRHT
jgi:predicted permease